MHYHPAWTLKGKEYVSEDGYGYMMDALKAAVDMAEKDEAPHTLPCEASHHRERAKRRIQRIRERDE